MKKLTAVLAAAAVSALALAVPAQAAAPTNIQPTKLPRGDDVRIAHLEGHTVVDGDRRVPVKGGSPYLLGESGDGYVLLVRGKKEYRVVRVAPGRAQKKLVGDTSTQVVLAGDGRTFAVTTSAQVTAVDVRSARTGRLVGTGDFAGYPRVLDLDGDHVVVGSFSKRAVDYNWRTGTSRKLTRKPAYAADLEHDLLAYFTKDPYNGGCSVVTTLSTPRRTVWRSCRERVEAFSPDGARIATVPKLTDGPGSGSVGERTVDGDLLGRYTVDGWFNAIAWESDTDLLMEANGPRKAATVRCSAGTCERASAVRATPDF